MNVAARIQELTRDEDVPILVSDETRRLTSSAIRFAPAGRALLRGRTEAVQTHVPVPEG